MTSYSAAALPGWLRPVWSFRAGAVVACTLTTAIGLTPTVHTVFGSFLVPIATDFGWPRATVSFALVLVAITHAFSSLAIGRMADLYGCRRVMIPGLVLFAAAVAALGLNQGVRWQFYGLYAFIGIVGSVAGQVLMTKLVAGWFDRSRGLFLGIVGGIGNGAGATAMPFYVQYLIQDQGWRAGYFGVGAAIAILSIPAVLFLLRDPPRQAPGQQDGEATDHADEAGTPWRAALRTPTFWLILVAIGAGAGGMTGAFTHVVPIMLDKGFALGPATKVLSLFAFVTVAWQITIGAMLDRFPIPRLAAPFFLIAAIGTVVMQESALYPSLLFSAALLGIGLGTAYGVLPYFLSRYFGLRDYGTISGFIYGVVTLVQGFTPFLMDAVFDEMGSYRWAMVGVAASLFLSSVLVLRLRPFPFMQKESV